MNKRALIHRLFVSFAVITSCQMHALTDHLSQSFMFTRPATHNLAMLQATWHNHIHEKDGTLLGSFQVVPFYNESLDHENCNKETARYFLPSCETTVIVHGDNSSLTPTGTYVRAEWINLPSNFYGQFSINPQQKKYGFVFEYNQDLQKFTDNKFLKHWWLDLSLPYEVAKNDIHLCEFVVSDTVGTPASQPSTITQAFNWETWNYGRLSNCELEESKIGSIRLMLGAKLYAKKNYEAIYYTFLSFPSGEKHDPRHIFSPFTGNNGHWGYGNGVNFQLPVTRKTNSWPLLFFVNVEHQYLFGKKQFRTFDIKNKPWSRYLLFNKIGSALGTTAVPGVNLLTRYVKVHPDSFVDISTGFRIKRSGFEAELGYNLWAHKTERIECISGECDEQCNVLDITQYGIAGTDAQHTASASTISGLAADDTTFTTLSLADIDLDSGAGRSATTHRVHGSVGYGYKGKNFDTFFNLGAFYEHPQNNASLPQWGIWGKVGGSF